MHAARSLVRAARPTLAARVAAPAPTTAAAAVARGAFSPATFSPRSLLAASPRSYSTQTADAAQEPAASPQPGQAQSAGEAASAASGAAADPKVDELTKLLDEQKKMVAELKVSGLCADCWQALCVADDSTSSLFASPSSTFLPKNLT